MHAAQDFHQRALAGAVLSRQHMHFAGTQIEVDRLEHAHRAKALADPAHREQRSLGRGRRRFGGHIVLTHRRAKEPLGGK